MSPWILVGFLLNAALGVIALTIDSFSFFSSSPGYAKLFVPLKQSGLMQIGMAVWFLALLASLIGVILLASGRQTSGLWLTLIGGLFFFPVGLIQSWGAMMMMDQAREAKMQEKLGPQLISNDSLATTLSRRTWVAVFDVGFGLFLALAAVGLVWYSNFQHFFRRLPSDLPADILTLSKPGATSKSYLLFGLLVLSSTYIAGLFWAALSTKISVAASWKVLSTVFLSGPTAPLAFTLGILLFLIGVSALRRPVLQLHEHYFTIRPHLFAKRLYSLYKDIQEIEQVGEEKVVLHLPVDGKQTKVKLPMKLADERKRRHVINTFQKRREAQQRMLFA